MGFQFKLLDQKQINQKLFIIKLYYLIMIFGFLIVIKDF
jgi:hypothetical protein